MTQSLPKTCWFQASERHSLRERERERMTKMSYYIWGFFFFFALAFPCKHIPQHTHTYPCTCTYIIKRSQYWFPDIVSVFLRKTTAPEDPSPKKRYYVWRTLSGDFSRIKFLVWSWQLASCPPCSVSFSMVRSWVPWASLEKVLFHSMHLPAGKCSTLMLMLKVGITYGMHQIASAVSFGTGLTDLCSAFFQCKWLPHRALPP